VPVDDAPSGALDASDSPLLTIFISTNLSLDFVHAAAIECGPVPPALQRPSSFPLQCHRASTGRHTCLDLHRESLTVVISHALHAAFLRFTLWNRPLDAGHPIQSRGLVSSMAVTRRRISIIFQLLSGTCSGTETTRVGATQGMCYRREARCSSILNRTIIDQFECDASVRDNDQEDNRRDDQREGACVPCLPKAERMTPMVGVPLEQSIKMRYRNLSVNGGVKGTVAE
jgi:hypothetical protein